MSALDRLITINISRQTKAVSKAGFGVALFVGEEAEKPAGQTSRVRVYDKDSYASDFDSADEVYKALQSYFSQSPSPVEAMVGYIEGVETLTDALDAISDENDDFYGVAIYDTTQAVQEEMAAWVESKRKIGGLRSADAGILAATTTDVAAVLNAAGYERTFVLFNETNGDYAEMAWFGRMFPKDAGSATWAYKSLSGITYSPLTPTQITNADSKKCNYYYRVGGQNITYEGVMASGEYIDVIRGVDFLHARMQEAIYSRLVNLDKIPYTNAGADVIVSEVEAIMILGIRQGILSNDPEPVVTRPDVKDVAFNDRAGRYFPDISFESTLAGAIHKTKIDGNVTV